MGLMTHHQALVMGVITHQAIFMGVMTHLVWCRGGWLLLRRARGPPAMHKNSSSRVRLLYQT